LGPALTRGAGERIATPCRMITLAFSAFMLSIIAAFHRSLDIWGRFCFLWLRAKVSLWLAEEKDPWESQISALSFLIAGLRSGQSLDASLLLLQRQSGSLELRERINKVLCQNPDSDFLSLLLASSLQTGSKALANLTDFLLILRAKRRISLKASSMSAQSRAQATTLSWLPLFLLACLGLMDAETFWLALGSSVFWVLLAFSSLFCLGGKIWISWLLEKCLQPTQGDEIVEERLLPQLILLFLARQSSGCDGISALEFAFSRMSAEEGLVLKSASGFLAFEEIVRRSSEMGAPVREEVKLFLQDLNTRTESRWEEKAQRLPVMMMAPLFLCYFPSSVLVIVALFLPLVGELL